MLTRARAVVTLCAVSSAMAGSLWAQQPPAGGSATSPGRPPAEGRPATLDQATARKAMAASEAAAASANANVSIAVVDSNGDLVLFSRRDGAAARAVTSSQGKARAAVLFGLASREVQESVAAGKPLTATLTPPPGGAWELTIQQGGVPILKDGKVIGAVGVGGAAPATDEKIAQAGVDAVSAR